MITRLLMLIPEQAYLVLLVFAGLLMIIGFRQLAGVIMVTVIAMAFFGPFLDSLIDSLPPWMFGLLCLFFALSMIRLVFGQRVGDNVISFLVYDFLRAPFRFLGWIVRGFNPRRRP